MDKKIFTIEINGIKESIEAVASLNRQLEELDKKIGEVSNKKITIQSDVSLNSSAIKQAVDNVSSKVSLGGNLSEELALQKELNSLKDEGTKLEAKQAAYQDESYQKVLAQKDVLKEIVEDQKTIAAQERLQADAYSNTMQGMKAKLADLKTSINSTDIGDSDKIKEMTTEANALTNKLKEMEQAYGQFGRNVGNYQSAAEGFKGINIQVAGVTQQFDNAKQALKTLQGELRTLQVKKDQGMILSPEEVKRFQELPSVVARLKSSIQDAGKPMDNLMDTMQSFVALAQVGKGIGAVFGIDGDKIQESIQKLVALQNVMQGMQTLQKQIQSSEFLGGWLTKGNDAIDSLVAKLTNANTAQQALTQSTNAGATASKAMATAEGAQAVATKATTVATKGLSLALKSIGIGLVISAVAALITYWDDIKKAFTSTVPQLKNLSTWFNKIKAVLVGVGNSILNYFVQPIATAGKLIKAVIEGNFKDIPKIITDGFKKTFNVVGNYQKGFNKETERQQEVHNEKMRKQRMKANEEAEKDAEAKYGKDHRRTQKFLKDQLKLVKKGSEEEKELKRKLWEEERKEKEENNRKNKSNASKNAKAEADAEKAVTKAKIDAMKDGLSKTITQLEEERKEVLAKLNHNNKNYKEQELEINKAYDKKIEDARKEHIKNVKSFEKDMYANLLQQTIDYYSDNISIIENGQLEVEDKQKKAELDLFQNNITSYGISNKESFSPSTQESMGIVTTINDEMVEDYKYLISLQRAYETALNNYKTSVINANEEIAESNDINVKFTKALLDGYEDYLSEKYSSIEDKENAAYVKSMLIQENYTSSLSSAFVQRESAIEAYWSMVLENTKIYAEAIAEEERKALESRQKQEEEAAKKDYESRMHITEEFYEKKLDLIEADHEKEKLSDEEYKAQIEKLTKDYKNASLTEEGLYAAKKEAINKKYAQEEYKIEADKNSKIQKTRAEYYQTSLQELRDFNTAISNKEKKSQISNLFGFTNWKQTNKNFRELVNATETQMSEILKKREQLNDDFNNGIIDKKTFENSLREYDSTMEHLGEKLDEYKAKLSGWNVIETIAQESQQYIQALGSSIASILSSLWDAEDAEYDREQDELDKRLDEAQNYYDKMDELAKEHADNMNSIEDDIAQAQGDARDRLIERYNAEKQAQREALREKKKAEKEQEKIQKQQDKLDKEQREREKKRDLIQAAINTAMAISSAAVNKWPIPAIPMMALAAATGAAQIAAIKSKQYANGGQLDGGVAVGKRHMNGGIKVLGGQAEIEGGEFVTNRQTTMNNVALLEFINSNKKKINLDDMIEFYGGNSSKVGKNILSASPKSKFADGGALPNITTNYVNNDALALALEKYANRPSVVSVVDIIDKQSDVQEVRAMAGL